ncbi:MAG: enoyl-CoA hydratase/isomerase family protein [Candidatus Asgardarchaeia archaeon]
MREFKNLIVNKTNNIGRITINRPKVLNALDKLTKKEIIEALGEFEDDKDVKVIIFTGAGTKAFSSGQDLEEMKGIGSDEAGNWVSGWEILDDRILNLKKPIIAMIRGYCVGGGFQCTLYMDIRIASTDSKFGLPEVNQGIPAISGTYMLGSLFGLGRVAPLLLLGELVPADEALRIGLVHKLFPPEDLESNTIRIAKELASKPPNAVRFMREWRAKLMNRSFGMTIAEQREAGREYDSQAFGMDETKGAIDAFLKK